MLEPGAKLPVPGCVALEVNLTGESVVEGSRRAMPPEEKIGGGVAGKGRFAYE